MCSCSRCRCRNQCCFILSDNSASAPSFHWTKRFSSCRKCTKGMVRAGHLKACGCHRMHHQWINQWHRSRRALFYSHCGSALHFSLSVVCQVQLNPLHTQFICPGSPEELSPIENKRSPDTCKGYVLCIPALACPPLCVLSSVPYLGAWKWKTKSLELKQWMWWIDSALLSCRWYLACCAAGPPPPWCNFCDTSLSM